MDQVISDVLNVIHWGIYIACFLCLARGVQKGVEAKFSLAYVGAISMIQAIYNGCPFTSLQNIFWERLGYIPVEIHLIVSPILPGELIPFARVLMFAIGVLFICPLLMEYVKIKDERNNKSLY